jgi:hypothetical protein
VKFQRDKYRCSEADLVGEFYHRAKLAGLDVYLEVKLPSSIHRSGEMRVDAVVVDGDEIVCCVEVKREGRQISGGTRQDQAYRSLELNHRVPTIWINSASGLDSVIADIRSLRRKAA